MGSWIKYEVRGSKVLPVGAEVALRPPCPGHSGWVTADTGLGRRRHYVDADGVLHFEDNEQDYRPPTNPATVRGRHRKPLPRRSTPCPSQVSLWTTCGRFRSTETW